MRMVFDFFFQLLGMYFLAVNFEVHSDFFLVIKKTLTVYFLLFSSFMHIIREG